MPDLDWDLTDFVEVLDVLPQSGEYGEEHVFAVSRDGMRLEVTVWPHESVVALALHRDGVPHPTVGHALFVRGNVARVKDRREEYLRFRDSVVAPGRFSYMDFDASPYDVEGTPCGLTVRVYARPHLRIEYER